MNIEELEKLRKKTKNILIFGIIISIIITALVYYYFKNIAVLGISFTLSMIIIIIIYSGQKNKYVSLYKETFVLKALQSAFNNLIYKQDRGISRDTIRNTGMINMGDRYSSNDYISGNYKGVNFIQSDIHIEEKIETTDSDGHRTTTYITLFMGRWMIFDFNKTFKANVQVCQKGFWNAKRGNWYDNIKYKKVEMEDEAFNKNFSTFAQNEHDAFYILTPSLMEKIKKLSNDIRGSLLFCFIDNKLHIGINNNEDSFECSIFKKIDVEKIMNDITEDIKLITDFIDELSLDNDLFRGEV